MNPIQWIKSNKLTSLLILVILYFILSRNLPHPLMGQNRMETFSYDSGTVSSGSAGNMVFNMAPATPQAVPPMMGKMAVDVYGGSTNPMATDRRVVTENTLSLQVADVPDAIARIKAAAESLTGFMVSSNVSKPEEAATGMITVRVPVTESDKMVTILKQNAIKVVNENIQGQDITDQYQDIDSRLATLRKNKARLETIMDDAKDINQILQVQQQIFILQDQIDALTGQQTYLKNTSETVLLTVYLSTDEFSLPYVPDTSWRPQVVFKQAVRSLVMDIRGIGNRIIWLTVYAIIWVPALLIVGFGIRYWKMRSKRVTLKKRS